MAKTRKKRFKCDECDRSYESEKSLAKHKRLTHSKKVSKFKCPVCASVLGQAHTLKEHFRDVHHQNIQIEDTKAHMVKFTKKLCVQPKIAQEERKKLPTLFCTHCGQKCTGSSNLKRHMKRHIHPNENVQSQAGIGKTTGSKKKGRSVKKVNSRRPQYILDLGSTKHKTGTKHSLKKIHQTQNSDEPYDKNTDENVSIDTVIEKLPEKDATNEIYVTQPKDFSAPVHSIESSISRLSKQTDVSMYVAATNIERIAEQVMQDGEAAKSVHEQAMNINIDVFSGDQANTVHARARPIEVQTKIQNVRMLPIPTKRKQTSLEAENLLTSYFVNNSVDLIESYVIDKLDIPMTSQPQINKFGLVHDYNITGLQAAPIHLDIPSQKPMNVADFEVPNLDLQSDEHGIHTNAVEIPNTVSQQLVALNNGPLQKKTASTVSDDPGSNKIKASSESTAVKNLSIKLDLSEIERIQANLFLRNLNLLPAVSSQPVEKFNRKKRLVSEQKEHTHKESKRKKTEDDQLQNELKETRSPLIANVESSTNAANIDMSFEHCDKDNVEPSVPLAVVQSQPMSSDRAGNEFANTSSTYHQISNAYQSIGLATHFPNTSVSQLNLIPNFRKLPKIPKLNKSTPVSQTVQKSIQPSEYFQSLKMKKLDSYIIPEEIAEIELENNATNFSNLKDMVEDSKQNEEKYFKIASSMIHLEEVASSTSVRSLGAKNMNIKFLSEKKNVFKMKLTKENPNISNAVAEINGFTIEPTNVGIPGGRPISGHVLEYDDVGKIIKLKIDDGLNELMECHTSKFDIEFHTNRLTFQLQHEALKYVKEHGLFQLLINNPEYKIFQTKCKEYSYVQKENLNEEQNLAVNKIISLDDKIPFLLFGPPGTGKTRTIVAAVEQIVRTTNKHILICAQSNDACNEITLRLMQVLGNGEIFRIFAKSYSKESLNIEMLPVSNFREGGFQFPSLEHLYKYRVIICTLYTAGSISRARAECNFDSSHFGYVFIDEAACIPESVTFIPIAGVCTDPGKVHSQIVLAGDPKQLDAVVKSEYAKKLGYKKSFMEYLFEQTCFKRDSNGDYNPNRIVQLKKNYRSHSTIIHVPNQLFYDGILEAAAPSDKTGSFSDMLPNSSFPIIFDSINGVAQQNNHSFHNTNEVEAVIRYVNQILKYKVSPSDIGIVSPYREQCLALKNACKLIGAAGITIGTAEIFQGQERPIIIISTVRTDDLGFVKDKRRLNVMITRAKSLLIVVGDHNTLCADGNWDKFYKYCAENGAALRNGRKMHKRIVFDK